MKTKAIASVSFCLMMVLLSGGITAVAAKPATRYSVVVHLAPHEPQRTYIFVAGSSASGEWIGGGSAVMTGGLYNAKAEIPDPSVVQVILSLKVVDGGPGTFENPYTGDIDDFFLEAEVTVSVDHQQVQFIPFPVEWIKKARLTFDFTEGPSVQLVSLWVYLDPYPWDPYIPDWWCYPPPALWPRLLMTVITQIG